MKVEKIFLDTETPISIFLKLQKAGLEPKYLLESAESPEKWGRYSFLVFGKHKIALKYKVDDVEREKRGEYGSKITEEINRKIDEIKDVYGELIKDVKTEFGIKRIPFGLVGYISYDAYSLFEKIDTVADKPSEGIPDIYLTFTPNIIIFDNLKKDVVLISEELGYIQLKNILSHGIDMSIRRAKVKEVRENVRKEDFEKMVEIARERIYKGDIIQVVLSRAKIFNGEIDPLSLYRALRILNPSPYMFYLKFDEIEVSGTSPEVLVRVEDGVAEVRPIAGTRKRGETQEEDEELENELKKDEKELAEHLMLVDLARNDLGRVCRPATVRVKKYGYVEKYSRVMHIVSDVEGITDRTPIDVLRACFPAGTVVGAPKIKAAEIISEIERERRGPYAGAVGYFSVDGNMDKAILIRTAFYFNQKLKIQAGAGIVYYSVPEKEYLETEHKMRAILEAINF